MTTQRKSSFSSRRVTRGPRAPSKTGRRASPVSTGKALIRLNTEALRTRELRAHARTERKLARLAAQLQRFNEVDRPGFLRWLHTTFGQIMSRHREILDAIAAKQAILRSVFELAERFNLSEINAYRKYLDRLAHPEAALEEDRRWEEQQQARQKQEESFADEVEPDVPFADEDLNDPRVKEFAEFFKKLFSPPQTKDSEEPPPTTVRELYRTLVHRLHPDRHGDLSEARKNLWHETQQAYQHKDLDALQGILARCEEGELGLGAHTPVSMIRHLIVRLSRSIRHIQKDLRAAQKQTAWNYLEKIGKPTFVFSIRTELTARVRRSEIELAQLSYELEQLELFASRPKKRARPPRDPFAWR